MMVVILMAFKNNQIKDVLKICLKMLYIVLIIIQKQKLLVLEELIMVFMLFVNVHILI